MGTVSSAKSSVASPSSCWSARAGPYSTGLSALAQRWRLQVASTPPSYAGAPHKHNQQASMARTDRART